MDSRHDTLTGGLPHSEIHGSKPACSSPWLIAACHVLHRLSVPRHPPNALQSLNLAAQHQTHARLALKKEPTEQKLKPGQTRPTCQRIVNSKARSERSNLTTDAVTKTRFARAPAAKCSWSAYLTFFDWGRLADHSRHPSPIVVRHPRRHRPKSALLFRRTRVILFTMSKQQASAKTEASPARRPDLASLATIRQHPGGRHQANVGLSLTGSLRTFSVTLSFTLRHRASRCSSAFLARDRLTAS